MNVIEKVMVNIINSDAMNKYVETMDGLQQTVSDKLSELLPESRRISGVVRVKSRGTCRYTVDTDKCSEFGEHCAFLVGRKPACQSACDTLAIVWTGRSMEIDPSKCTNCGKCGNVCLHYAIERDGEAVGLTPSKIGRLLTKGALKGITFGMLG